jgi:hypothetical protein
MSHRGTFFALFDFNGLRRGIYHFLTHRGGGGVMSLPPVPYGAVGF